VASSGRRAIARDADDGNDRDGGHRSSALCDVWRRRHSDVATTIVVPPGTFLVPITAPNTGGTASLEALQGKYKQTPAGRRPRLGVLQRRATFDWGRETDRWTRPPCVPRHITSIGDGAGGHRYSNYFTSQLFPAPGIFPHYKTFGVHVRCVSAL
jgi:hypothetical protein